MSKREELIKELSDYADMDFYKDPMSREDYDMYEARINELVEEDRFDNTKENLMCAINAFAGKKGYMYGDSPTSIWSEHIDGKQYEIYDADSLETKYTFGLDYEPVFCTADDYHISTVSHNYYLVYSHHAYGSIQYGVQEKFNDEDFEGDNPSAYAIKYFADRQKELDEIEKEKQDYTNEVLNEMD
jgi:hypothetical protein